MPSNLLEKPAVEDALRETKVSSVRNDVLGESGKPPRRSAVSERKPEKHSRAKARLREVFEGHEDFLGWTPD